MALLTSIQGEMQLALRMLGKSYDPFQQDLEWFEYEVLVEGAPMVVGSEEGKFPTSAEVRRARGKFNRKELNDLLRSLDDLLDHSEPLRFEPGDLNFYFDWSHETPLVYLVVTWFDLAFASRRLDRRFPTAHAGFRFLADRESVMTFREDLEREFAPAALPRKQSSPLIN